MRARRILGLLARCLTLGWAAWWCHAALNLWLQHSRCRWIAGPFLPCGPGAQAWQAPLLQAVWPLALVGVACLLRPLWRKGLT